MGARDSGILGFITFTIGKTKPVRWLAFYGRDGTGIHGLNLKRGRMLNGLFLRRIIKIIKRPERKAKNSAFPNDEGIMPSNTRIIKTTKAWDRVY
jgi:hypothetical protein